MLDQAGMTVAKLASTVADLHQLGLVHGRIDPSHVLLGPAGRPVLCGFTGGGAEGDIPPEGPGAIAEFRDPLAHVGAPLSTTTDVYALGTLLRVLAIGEEPTPSRSPNGGSPSSAAVLGTATCAVPFSRWPINARTRSRCGGPQRDGSRPTSKRCCHTWPQRGCAAGDTDAVAAGPRPPTARRLTLGAAAVGLVLVFWGVASTRSNDTTAATPSPPISSAAPSVESSTEPKVAPSTSPTKHTSDVTLVGDRIVSVDGHQFAVGDPGDRVVLGDWNCDGEPTAALARPSTGSVYVFDRWPVVGVEATAEPITTVIGAVDVRAEERGDCTALFAVRADGSESEVL